MANEIGLFLAGQPEREEALAGATPETTTPAQGRGRSRLARA